MSDLIDRQAAADALIAQANHEGAYGYIDAKEAEDVLMALPTVDVPDRKVGEWIWEDSEERWGWACSNCGYGIRGDRSKTNYCPNCGARMKGESDEHTGTDCKPAV